MGVNVDKKGMAQIGDRCMQNAYNYSATDGCMVSDAIMMPCCHCDATVGSLSLGFIPAPH